ncbi:MAG: insulinase family protein [Calditrichaceae bacterium]
MKRISFLMFLCLTVILLFSQSLMAGYEVNKTYHGFKLIEKKFVKEVNADCYYFIHEKSGARLLKIAAEDPNKTFSITFKTVPESNAGTPHIMEHSVLNGSENFPVKSPFDVLLKGSLNTFLNAMTGGDLTIYPVASMNNKDYFNLMHIYLDAVFNPLIYKDPRILKQEGWHYELTNKDSALVYKGVVYNEMKGAFSSPDRELGYQVDKNLFPDNGYHFSSGGYPSEIPTLTYEDFINFHKKYYHPSNSYIYLYGDADLDKELAFIDREYLSAYKKSDAEIKIPLQKPFNEMKEVNAYYSAPEGSSMENQSYLALNYVSGLNTDQKLIFALDILAEVLVNGESAPVRLAVQEAGIGKEIRAGVDEMKQNVFQIRVQNANPADKDKFLAIVNESLQKVIDNGLDMEAVEGRLNRIEFRLREGDDAQKGLTYNFQALNGWLFAQDPFLSLQYEKPLAEIKSAIKEGYLQKVIKEYMLNNPHSLLLVLEPKPGLEAEIAEKTETELADYKASLSKKEVNELVDETKGLIEYQEREDSDEALATIPMLELKDINPKAEWYGISENKVKGVSVLHHETFTNNVVYARLYYDLRVLPTELVPYAALLAEVMGSMNTRNYSYGELDKALNLQTGGFSTFLNSYLENRNDDNLLPKFIVNSKSTNDKVDKMFELITEIVNNTNYADKDRLEDVLTRYQSRLESNIKQNGFGYTRTRLLSYFSNEGMFDEMTGGVEYYRFITGLAGNFDKKSDEIIANLNKTAALLFNRNNLMTSVTCSAEDLPKFNDNVNKFIATQPEHEVNYQTWNFKPEKKNEGLLAASKVQYVIKGYDYKKLGYHWNGQMRVLSQILSSDYLQNQIRVIGGAYGGFSAFGSNGIAYFASYRDPNLKKTLQNYDATPEYLDKFAADDKEMVRYIIGTIARIDRPLTPSQQGNAAVRYYFEKTTREDLQKEREAALSVTAKDIKDMKKMVEDILSQNTYCVYGNEEKIQSEKKLFSELVPLSK